MPANIPNLTTMPKMPMRILTNAPIFLVFWKKSSSTGIAHKKEKNNIELPIKKLTNPSNPLIDIALKIITKLIKI